MNKALSLLQESARLLKIGCNLTLFWIITRLVNHSLFVCIKFHRLLNSELFLTDTLFQIQLCYELYQLGELNFQFVHVLALRTVVMIKFHLLFHMAHLP